MQGLSLQSTVSNSLQASVKDANFQGSTRSIGIYIISFNRLDYLQAQVAYLESHGFTNIHIVDNLSTYPPLLEYLDKSPHTVHRMKKNYGHMVLFKASEFKRLITEQYFVLTDPDVIPHEDCPSDFLDFFMDVLQKYPEINKVGFSLKIEDLPDDYPLKEAVIEWESRFYRYPREYKGHTLYSAPIDTTFALYRPRKKWKKKDFFKALRTGSPYSARHLPWYISSEENSAEEIFYNSTDTGSGTWNGNLSQVLLKQKHASSTVWNVKLFFILPLLKIKVKNNKKSIYLFNFIPIYKGRA